MNSPSLSVVQAPARVISLADAKKYMRVEYDDDDDLIETLISSAVENVDGATGWLGRALGLQSLALRASHFPGQGYDCARGFDAHWHSSDRRRHHLHEIRLPCPPVLSVTSIVYADPNGFLVSYDPALYALLPEIDARFVVPAFGTVWPQTRVQPGAVVITYVAGYAPPDADQSCAIPTDIKQALLLMVGSAYDNRSDKAPITGLAESILTKKQVWI
ncbi:head-tail connector protein [Lichenihabitans psoromatis]|uniref:head-tail connector protein n=1 Tax=Lichenihabitans psoromatis TaxID=2528642 RepID=UPI00103855BE|nr:head-tail connector protein [Lichenihabitans psoromatis]